MKNIVVGILSLFILFLAYSTFQKGPAFQGGEGAKVIADMKNFDSNKASNTVQAQEDEDAKRLKALRDKAGNIAEFKVSQNYRSKCGSCHGVDGRGIVGPNLFGKTSDEIYQALLDYKSGRKENAIMKGLLMNMEEPEMKELSDEIGSFKTKAVK
jgi:cytochrome c553